MVKVKPTEKNNKITVKASNETNVFSVKDNMSEFYAKLSERWASADGMVDGIDYSSKYYSNVSKECMETVQSHRDETVNTVKGFQDIVDSSIVQIEELARGGVNNVQGSVNTAILEVQNIIDSSLETVNTKTIESVDTIENASDNAIVTIRENAEDIINRVGLNMFDTVVKDHILTYEESRGLALQGTYVYKNAIAGERYGYPDFYNKCLEEYSEANKSETVNAVTLKVHDNGHKFYDIANKEAIDSSFNALGMAWYYGIDEENERIFLPRNVWFEQMSMNDVGKAIEAGLPTHTHTRGTMNITGYVAGNNLTLEEGGQSGGALYFGGGSYVGPSNQGAYYGPSINFDASRNWTGSTSTGNYSKSLATTDTVQPNAVKKLLYICVGNTVNYESMTEVVNQGMDILEQVNYGIESRVKTDGSNADFPYITETYVNGTSWYRIWSDGWKEQGGVAGFPQYYNNYGVSVTFLKPFSNTNYTPLAQMKDGAEYWANVAISVSQSATQLHIVEYADTSNLTISAHKVNWYACGY